MKRYAIFLLVFVAACSNKLVVKGGRNCPDGYCPVTVDQLEENSQEYDMKKVAAIGHLSVVNGDCDIFSAKDNWIALDVTDTDAQRLKKLDDKDILVKGIYKADSASVMGLRVGSIINIVQIGYQK